MRKGDEVDDKVGVGADECVACGGGSFAAVPEWRLLNVVATQMDVTIEGQHYQTQVTDTEVALVNDFLTTKVSDFLHTHTGGKVKFSFSNYATSEPITSLSEVNYDDFDVINHPTDKNYVPKLQDLPEVVWQQVVNYDVMLTTVRMPEKLASNWLGLGFACSPVVKLVDPVRYQSVGFENIYLRVYLHELMHGFLGYFAIIGYQIPNIHRPADYGYSNEMELFKAILSGEMRDPATGRNLGITAEMWAKTPLSQTHVPPTIKLDLTDLHLVDGKLVLQVGQEVHAQLKVTASPDNPGLVVTYFDNHQLPPGLTLSAQGLLSGKVTTPGTWYVGVTAQAGTVVDSTSFVVEVKPAASLLKLDLSDLNLQGDRLILKPGQRLNAQVRAQAPAGAAVTFTGSGLPSGFALSSDGWLSGVAGAAGQWPVTLTARAAGQQDTARFQLVVAQGGGNQPILPDPPLPGGGGGSGDEGGGGGCHAGLGALALLLVASLGLRRNKKKNLWNL